MSTPPLFLRCRTPSRRPPANAGSARNHNSAGADTTCNTNAALKETPVSTTDQHPSGESANRVDTVDTRHLHGMKAIAAYMGKSESTRADYL